jgi:methionine aminopeptidase
MEIDEIHMEADAETTDELDDMDDLNVPMIMDKYTCAAKIANQATSWLQKQLIHGAGTKIVELCAASDNFIEQEVSYPENNS